MMSYFEQIFRIGLNVIEKIGPTLATLLAVYLAYRYAKKQKLLENKDEEHKKIRIATSNLLQIWRELSTIEFYINSEKFFAELIFKSPVAAANYFNIDLNRVDTFKRMFTDSKEEIKSINVLLFYNLENSFMDFNKMFRLFDTTNTPNPPENENIKEMIQKMLTELVRDLEEIIKETSCHLPVREKKEIQVILDDHHKALKKTNIDYEVPKFLIDLINSIAPLKEKITDEELALLTNDDTVRLIMNKAAPIVFNYLFQDANKNFLKVIDGFVSQPEQFAESFNVEDILLSISISDEEYVMLLDNKPFYKLVCAAFLKFQDKIPWEFKRTLLKINSGVINLKAEFEAQKAQVMMRQQIMKDANQSA